MSSDEERPLPLNRFDDGGNDDDDDEYFPPYDHPSPGEDEDEFSEADQDMQEESEDEGDNDDQGFQLALDPASLADDRVRSTFVNMLLRYGSLSRRPAAEASVDLSSDEEQDPAGWSSSKGGYRDSQVPLPGGIELLQSGEFGRIHSFARQTTPNFTSLRQRIYGQRLQTRASNREQVCADLLPNTNGTVVATYRSRAYVGQFSTDSSFYYTCCRDFDLRIYDMTAPITPLSRRTASMRSDHLTSMKLTKTIHGLGDGWTITDSHLSPDNSALLYSSLDSTLHMVKTQEPDQEQIQLHLGHSTNNSWYGYRVAVFSCRFSADGREVIAGGSGGALFVYDLGEMRRTLSISAHSDDINSCCWADTSSGNVLVSASDDTSLKVWDRRSLGSSHKPSGVLIGHTEGITHVAPKGDGRYVISNGKDQVLRLWDLRKMRSHNDWNGRNPYGHNRFDYRTPHYPKPRHTAHPLDTSVMRYKGHSVLRTLIRCHFSPTETTGGAYIYSGSSDGRIHIWSLDGRVVQVLDRSKTSPITGFPSGADTPTASSRGFHPCVRDVSWHTESPILMSCAWDGEDSSTVAMHEWKGFGKHAMSLDDVIERDRVNASYDDLAA